jgi:4-oxalocrotonate tautomerase family enzyme
LVQSKAQKLASPRCQYKENIMPIITCDIRVGRTNDQKSQLAMGLTKAVQEATGVSIDYMFVVIREMPAFNFVESGEHVPDYAPGPDGQDLAGHEQLRLREASRSRSF